MFPNLDVMRLQALEDEEITDQKEIILGRRYYDGNQDVYLNERALEYLGLHSENKFKMNVCKVVVTSVLDELHLVGVGAGEAGNSKPIADWASKVLAFNRIDEFQKYVHECALRDRESFVIVDWDTDNGSPRFTWMPRYTSLSTNVDGDEMGVVMYYPDDDYSQHPIAAVKRWIEMIPDGPIYKKRMRMTIYYPDRIERFVFMAGWEQYVDNDGDQWPIPWVDQAGKPLGIAAIHFRNAGMRPEHWDAIPMQDATNKLFVDILGSADSTGFRVFFTSGFIPTMDGLPLDQEGSNVAVIAPGQLIGTTKEGATMSAIDGADPTPLVNTLTQIIQYTAHITATPPSRFSNSAQVQSGDSQQEQNKPFFAKLNDRRVRFGRAWEDVMSLARKLENLWGVGGLDETTVFSALWEHSFSLDELIKKRTLGVPQEQIWKEMGYDQAEIEAMKQMDEYQAKQAAQQMSIQASKSMMMMPGDQMQKNMAGK